MAYGFRNNKSKADWKTSSTAGSATIPAKTTGSFNGYNIDGSIEDENGRLLGSNKPCMLQGVWLGNDENGFSQWTYVRYAYIYKSGNNWRYKLELVNTKTSAVSISYKVYVTYWE